MTEKMKQNVTPEKVQEREQDKEEMKEQIKKKFPKIQQFEIDNGALYILTDEGKLYHGRLGTNKFERIKTPTL